MNSTENILLNDMKNTSAEQISQVVLILEPPPDEQSLDELFPVSVDALFVLLSFTLLLLQLLLVPGV